MRYPTQILLREWRILERLNETIIAIHDGVFHSPFSGFQAFVLERLRALITFDSAAWINGGHFGNDMHSLLLINQNNTLIERYLADYSEIDLVRNHAAANPGKAFRIEDTMPIQMYREHRAYRELWQPAGIEHAMAIAAVDPISGLVELIVLWGADPDRPFTDDERTLLEACAPHIMAVWRHRHLLHLYEQSVAVPSAQQFRRRGHAICDGAGTIYASDQHFSKAMSDNFPSWVGPELPACLKSMIQSGTALMMIDGLDFSLTRGEQRSLLSVSKATPPLPLSAAELRVARLFGSGQTHSEIASSIGVTRSTVRNQLSAVYRKLSIHSKVELVRLLEGSPAPDPYT